MRNPHLRDRIHRNVRLGGSGSPSSGSSNVLQLHKDASSVRAWGCEVEEGREARGERWVRTPSCQPPHLPGKQTTGCEQRRRRLRAVKDSPVAMSEHCAVGCANDPVVVATGTSRSRMATRSTCRFDCVRNTLNDSSDSLSSCDSLWARCETRAQRSECVAAMLRVDTCRVSYELLFLRFVD